MPVQTQPPNRTTTPPPASPPPARPPHADSNRFAHLLASNPQPPATNATTASESGRARGTSPTAASAPTATAQIVASSIDGNGADPGVREGTVSQLRDEAALNTGEYADQLSTLADRIERGEAELPPGSYQRIETNGWLTPSTPGPANPLAIPPLGNSIEQSAGEVRRIDQQIQQAYELGALSGSPMAATAQVSALENRRERLISAARLQESAPLDGTVNLAVNDPANRDKPPLIFINGVNTDVNRSALQALELSNTLESPVAHVVNVSDSTVLASISGDVAPRAFPGGQNAERTEQRIQQHVIGNYPAATSAAELVLGQLYDPALRDTNTPVRVAGYSQGSAIAGNAIRLVESNLARHVESGRISQQEKEQMLDRVRLLGIGPALPERSIARNYVGIGQDVQPIADLEGLRYRVILDVDDPVPTANGVGRDDVFNLDAARSTFSLSNGNIGTHLSYFEQYRNTDPGAVFNPEFSTELHRWYAGSPDALEGIAELELNR